MLDLDGDVLYRVRLIDMELDAEVRRQHVDPHACQADGARVTTWQTGSFAAAGEAPVCAARVGGDLFVGCGSPDSGDPIS